MQWESCLACSHMHSGHLEPCEVVIFSKFELSFMHTRPLRYLDAPHLMHMPDVTSLGSHIMQNNIIMMSLAFAFHSCHVGIMWHDVIGVHIS